MANMDCYTLETPENIEVEFELAGLGSRFCAIFIDTLLISLIAFVLFLAWMLFLPAVDWLPMVSSSGRHRVTEWLLAALILIVGVLILDGYFIFFEWLMRGQTPGKKSMKVRVIRDDGTPIALNEVLVRNILRIVDFLPAAYAVGTIVMFFNPLCKRLGDVAAGTIVVKEGQLDYRANTDKKYSVESSAFAAPNSELTPAERRVLTGFLQRRDELLSSARTALAERVASPLYEKYGGHYDDAESYIERLVEGRHHES